MPHSQLPALQHAVARHCRGKVTSTALKCLTLYKTDHITDPVLVVYEPRIYIVVQGEKVLYLNEHPFTYNESHYLISTLDLPVSGRITRATAESPYLALCITFSPLEIEQLLKDLRAPSPSSSPMHPSPAMGLSSITPELINALLRLVSLLDMEDGRDQNFLARLYKTELLYHFLHGDQGHVLYEIAHQHSDLSRINRAIIYLRHHYHEHFEMGTLVDIAGMSQSNFYKRFSVYTGMTPVQYRTKLRLQEARRLMVHEDMGAAHAGFLVGYESPSQFSRDYKRTFGRPPQADLTYIRSIGIEAYKRQHEDVWL